MQTTKLYKTESPAHVRGFLFCGWVFPIALSEWQLSELRLFEDSLDLRFAGPPSLRLRRKEGPGKWMKDKRLRTKDNELHPLSSEAEERVDKRSDVWVS